MAAFKVRQTVDLNSTGPQTITQAYGHVGDAKAHQWDVVVVRGVTPVDLTGYTAMALVNNGVGTVEIVGTITGNVATAIFPAACYTEGVHECFMRITKASDSSEVITALMRLNVTPSETDTPIDPGTDITATLSALLAAYGGYSAKLADNAISPDDYTGTDAAKIQAAVNAAISGKRAIRFSRMYDVTGQSAIVFSKPESDRTVLHLLGVGGGVRRDDAGYVFTGYGVNMGDICSLGMRYLGTGLSTTCVWDCNQLIRITSIGDCFVKIKAAEADTRYAQSLRFEGFTSTGNGGWAFSWHHAFDVTIKGLIEAGANGIRNSAYTTYPVDNFNLEIDCCIEGMTGEAISLGACGGVSISGYYEWNAGGYIDVSKSASPHAGISVSKCMFGMSETQIANHTKAIKWGKIGASGALSFGNYAHMCDLHEMATDTGVLTSIGDTAGALFASQAGAPTVLNAKSIISPTDYYANGYYWFPNLLQESDFPDGAIYWNANNAGVPVIADNVMTFTPTAQYGGVNQSLIPCVANHKYYLAATVSGTPDTTLIVSDSVNFTEFVAHSASAGFEVLSKLFTAPATVEATMIFQIRSGAATGWETISVKYANFANLTTIFGAGKEPSGAEMNKLYADFVNQWMGHGRYVSLEEYLLAAVRVLKGV